MALYNLARCYVGNTPGTGNITVGARVPPWISFTSAGVLTGTVSYAVVDYQIGVTGRIPISSECGTATYTSGTGILSNRTVTNSSNSNALVNLSSSAEVYITALAADFPSSSSLTVGTSVINGGANTRILYDNTGILGEYTITGTGTVVAMQTSPAFTTPSLGVATATSINGTTLTTGTGTLTLGPAKVATISNTLTFTGTDGSSVAFGTGGTVLYGNQSITLSGDVTGSGSTAITTTLATVNSNVGSFGSATQVGTFTVNGKGLTTAAANVTITPAVGSITGLGTGVATALAINTGSAGAFVTFNGAGGTPLSMVGTNITGTAAGLTAGTASAVAVGGITGLGTGVATALAANVNGSGAISLTTSPVFVTPTLGVASATSVNKLVIVAPATASTLTIADGKALTVSATHTAAGGDGNTLAIAANKTLTVSNSLTLAGTDSTTMTFPGTSSNVLTTGNSATTTVGYLYTSYNGATVSSGTFTPAAANGNYQYYTNNGAHTLAVPAADSAIDVLITNGASAGTITFSGYTVGSSTGSTIATTNTNKYIISIRRINAVSTYSVYALQ